MTELTHQKIVANQYIILSLGQRKTYLVRVDQGKSFHTHKGYVKFDDLIGKEYGSTITSSLGFEFVALKPQLRDYIMKCARQTQICTQGHLTHRNVQRHRPRQSRGRSRNRNRSDDDSFGSLHQTRRQDLQLRNPGGIPEDS